MGWIVTEPNKAIQYLKISNDGCLYFLKNLQSQPNKTNCWSLGRLKSVGAPTLHSSGRHSASNSHTAAILNDTPSNIPVNPLRPPNYHSLTNTTIIPENQNNNNNNNNNNSSDNSNHNSVTINKKSEHFKNTHSNSSDSSIRGMNPEILDNIDSCFMIENENNVSKVFEAENITICRLWVEFLKLYIRYFKDTDILYRTNANNHSHLQKQKQKQTQNDINANPGIGVGLGVVVTTAGNITQNQKRNHYTGIGAPTNITVPYSA